MSVKASVSISEQQDDFARSLVEDGRYSSVSAVVQQGLDLLKRKTEAEEVETEALKALLRNRMDGPFVTEQEFGDKTDAMLAEKRKEYGLDG